MVPSRLRLEWGQRGEAPGVSRAPCPESATVGRLRYVLGAGVLLRIAVYVVQGLALGLEPLARHARTGWLAGLAARLVVGLDLGLLYVGFLLYFAVETVALLH